MPWQEALHVVFGGPPKREERTRHAGGIRYTPKATRQAKAAGAETVRQAMADAGVQLIPVGVALHVRLTAVYKRPAKSKHIPKGWGGRWFFVRKPDADNVAKLYLDSCTGVLWHDDAQVSTLHVEQWYGARGEEPHVLLDVARWCAMEAA